MLMAPNPSYKFHFIHIRHTFGMLIALFSGIIGILPLGIIVDQYLYDVQGTGWLFVGCALLWLGTMAYFAVKLIRARNKTEEVSLTEEGMQSSVFGFIRYGDIQHYEIRKGLSFINVDKPSPSLFLRLADGRRVRFDLNIKRYDDEIKTYMAFLEAFVGRMGKRAGVAPSNASAPAPAYREAEAKENLERARKRQLSAKNLVIPVTAVFAVLMFARTCSEDLVKLIRPDPLQSLRTEAVASNKRETEALRKTIVGEGEVYLLGHDAPDVARPVLIPNSESRATSQIALFSMMETNDAIRDFIAHKDSLGYHLYLWRDSLHVPQVYYPAPPRDAAGRTLFFFVYDEKATLSPYFRVGPRREKPKAPFTLLWAITYQDIDELPQKMENSRGYTNLADLAYLLNMQENTRFYMASSRFHGHTRDEFEEAAAVVLQTLKEKEVDVSGLDVREYEDGLL